MVSVILWYNHSKAKPCLMDQTLKWDSGNHLDPGVSSNSVAMWLWVMPFTYQNMVKDSDFSDGYITQARLFTSTSTVTLYITPTYNKLPSGAWQNTCSSIRPTMLYDFCLSSLLKDWWISQCLCLEEYCSYFCSILLNEVQLSFMFYNKFYHTDYVEKHLNSFPRVETYSLLFKQ